MQKYPKTFEMQILVTFLSKIALRACEQYLTASSCEVRKICFGELLPHQLKFPQLGGICNATLIPDPDSYRDRD